MVKNCPGVNTGGQARNAEMPPGDRAEPKCPLGSAARAEPEDLPLRSVTNAPKCPQVVKGAILTGVLRGAVPRTFLSVAEINIFSSLRLIHARTCFFRSAPSFLSPFTVLQLPEGVFFEFRIEKNDGENPCVEYTSDVFFRFSLPPLRDEAWPFEAHHSELRSRP